MAIGRRCDLGCETWPDDFVYKTCLRCGEPTARCSNVTPLDDAEARSILLHEEFEKAYAKHCALLGQPVEGPLPELE